MDNIFYVYVYLDPRIPGKFIYGEYKFDFEPFYVGKGKDSRYKRHLCAYGNNPIKKNKINKILSTGLSPVIVKVCENLNNKDALDLEIMLINRIGRITRNSGPLTNFTKGGETYLGYKHRSKYLDTLNKPVVKYDLDGNIIAEYISVKDASEKNNIQPQTMSQICSGKIKIYKDEFIYLYKDDKFKPRNRLIKSYPVNRIDFNMNIKQYNSISDAALDNNISDTKIGLVCMGDRFQSGGYLWRYKNHPKIEEFNYKINSKFGKYLNIINKEIYSEEKVYKNILHVIKDEKNIKINNLYNLLLNKKIFKFNEFKTN